MFKFLAWLIYGHEEDKSEGQKKKDEKLVWILNNPPPYSKLVLYGRGAVSWEWDEEHGGQTYWQYWDSDASFKAKEYRTTCGHNEADVKYYIETGKWP